jgi:hypothetical protein
MMARKIGDICAAGEKFQAREGGEKTRWIKCGILLETDKGFRIKMDCIPLVSDGWFAVFEDQPETTTRPAPARAERSYSEPRREQAPARQQVAMIDPPPEEDIPF